MEILFTDERLKLYEIAEKLHVCSKTIKRDIDKLEQDGFGVDRHGRSSYYITHTPKRYLAAENYTHFTPEEAFVVNAAIAGLTESNSLRASIIQKLSPLNRCSDLPDFITDSSTSRNVCRLNEAIRSRRKAILRDYASAQSRTIRDRHVEPFMLSCNLTDVWCYDLDRKENRTFRISRIGETDILEEHWTEEHLHRRRGCDCFRIDGDLHEHIILRLGVRAKDLLLEEFPLAEKDLRRDKRKWILDTWVSGMQGVGRFVIGLSDDITVLEGDMLKEYIRTYTEKYLS